MKSAFFYYHELWVSGVISDTHLACFTEFIQRLQLRFDAISLCCPCGGSFDDARSFVGSIHATRLKSAMYRRGERAAPSGFDVRVSDVI